MPNNLIVPFENITLESAPEIYKAGGLASFFHHIQEQTVNEVPDLSTDKGRKRIASVAAQVSKSKTLIEKPGREYLKYIKALPKEVEAELRKFTKQCDELRDQIRKPLTDWEESNKSRTRQHEVNIKWLFECGTVPIENSEAATTLIGQVESLVPGEWCEEYLDQYVEHKVGALKVLNLRRASLLQTEADRRELEVARVLLAAQQQQEHEQRIAAEAAEKATKAAQAAATFEIEQANERVRLAEAEASRLLHAMNHPADDHISAFDEQQCDEDVFEQDIADAYLAELNGGYTVEPDAFETAADPAQLVIEQNEEHVLEVKAATYEIMINKGLTHEMIMWLLEEAEAGRLGALTINYCYVAVV